MLNSVKQHKGFKIVIMEDDGYSYCVEHMHGKFMATDGSFRTKDIAISYAIVFIDALMEWGMHLLNECE